MEYYYFIEAVVGIVVGLLLALCTKKAGDPALFASGNLNFDL